MLGVPQARRLLRSPCRHHAVVGVLTGARPVVEAALELLRPDETFAPRPALSAFAAEDLRRRRGVALGERVDQLQEVEVTVIAC